ncbi:glutamate-cysteine ligase family protein [Pseudonocardia sp.]|uniref:glutamate-cysteine ligase family protein n=1 Tax=Pseudonocardia sp. TaxID=60912 RepID=UPI003D0DEA12
MPVDRPVLDVDGVRSLARAAFAPGNEQLWGLEVETVVERRTPPHHRPRPAELPDRDALPGGSSVTVEPGGQLEISTPPRRSIDAALDVLAADEAALATRIAAAGLRPVACAVDLRHEPSRVLDLPRYRAMEAFFDARGPEGRQMMCNTASFQINVSNHPTDVAGRWRLLHRLAPLLVATFANSPGLDRHGVRWACLRQRIWAGIDPRRTGAPDPTRDPVEAWTRYVLDADVMLIGAGADTAVGLPPGLPFGRWLRDGHPAGWPTPADLAYHMTTLFPPVRPRGWLELRVLDAMPAEVREVAALVVAAAVTEPAASTLAARLPCTASRWSAAARHGLDDPALAEAADLLFGVVVRTLPAVTDRADRIERVLRFHAEHVRRATARPRVRALPLRSFEPAEQLLQEHA